MNKHTWYWTSILALLIVLTASAGGCTAVTLSKEPAPSYTSPPDETGTTTSSTPVASANEGTVPSTDSTVVGSDPVSGRNQEIDLSWEQLCLSSQYQVQIAKDLGFTIIVLDTGAFAPASATSPAAYYPAGGRARSPSSLTQWANLEAGHTYYWRARVRQAATGQYMLSPWSEVRSLTVKSGLPASNPSYGIQPVYPNNGRSGCPVKPVSFSWSPLKDTMRYKFVLAKDAAMTQVVKEAEVTTTAYEYNGQLEYGKSYFWRVMALEPAPSDWSATFNFQTEAAPPPPPTPPTPTHQTPVWAWVVIAIGTALVIATTVLIFKARRR